MTQPQSILIADDDIDLCDVIASRVRSLNLDAVIAHDAASALERIDQVRPDLICLDVDMPHGNGLAVSEMIANDERLAGIPIIILTGKTDDETIQRCHNLCVYYIPKGPDLWTRLQPLVQDLLSWPTTITATATDAIAEGELMLETTDPVETQEQVDPIMESIFSALGVDEGYLDNGTPVNNADAMLASSASVETPAERPVNSTPPTDDQQPWVLHVDDDADLSNALKIRLESFGVTVVQAFDGMAGVRHAFAKPANAIILDFQMPHGNGDYVLKRLKQCEATKNIPVIVLTGRREQELEREMMKLGVDRFFSKPVRFELLLDALRDYIPLTEPRGEACLLA